MLSDEGYFELDYRIDKIEDELYHLSNGVENSHMNKQDEENLADNIDNVISHLMELKQKLKCY
jgi:hypothetical protein